MTTEREMLEYVAKACGIDAVWFDEFSAFVANDTPNPTWNPLTNSSDCAAMCAKLWISVLYGHHPCEFLSCFAHNSHDPEIAYYKDHDNSRLKAWMWAATMVAAKIGGYEE